MNITKYNEYTFEMFSETSKLVTPTVKLCIN